MTVRERDYELKPPFPDRALFEASPFLEDLMGQGTWREREAGAEETGLTLSSNDFRRQVRQAADDPEKALELLRNLRIRTLLDLARADLEGRIPPHRIRVQLRRLGELLLYGAYIVADGVLRQRYVHPLVLERRNILPPMAICSLSRLGSMDPFYTTAPAPIFIHSREAAFAPALVEKDFERARRSTKEWLPAREYFLRLASRIMSYLWAPDAGGKRLGSMSEDHLVEWRSLLPGPLVLLFSAFEEHFLSETQPLQVLNLLRLRFLVGQDRLGQAVEDAAKDALRRTAEKLGPRLSPALSVWFGNRALAEGLPMNEGGLLDLERAVRLLQFRYGRDDARFLTPSPLKAMDLMTQAGLVGAEERLILRRAYTWQWFLANRLALLGRRFYLGSEYLGSSRFDREVGLEGAGERLQSLMASARAVSRELLQGRKSGVV